VLTEAEQEIIALVEQAKQRKLTPQEISVVLQQARDLGEIS
jgi:hypothetical protein